MSEPVAFYALLVSIRVYEQAYFCILRLSVCVLLMSRLQAAILSAPSKLQVPFVSGTSREVDIHFALHLPLKFLKLLRRMKLWRLLIWLKILIPWSQERKKMNWTKKFAIMYGKDMYAHDGCECISNCAMMKRDESHCLHDRRRKTDLNIIFRG